LREKDEEKRNENKTEILLESHVEAEIPSVHVGSLRDMADHIQVCAVMGMDDGLSGGKAWFLCPADVGTEIRGL
jgi:hypothetical protein